jgi:type I restriction enzyme S subunit
MAHFSRASTELSFSAVSHPGNSGKEKRVLIEKDILMSEKLPKGWVKTTLGEIAQPSRERALPAEVPHMRYVGLEHIQPHTMKLLGHGQASEVRSSSVRFSYGDVLYGKMRPYLNKIWVAEFDGICSAEFLVFPKCDGLNNWFLALRLNAEDFVTYANGQVSGERPRVDFEALSHFPILLPPAAEQERIVAKLNAALERIHRAEAATRRAMDRLQRYRGAVLRVAVTSELTREWRKTHTLDETGVQLLQLLLKARRARWEEDELKRLREAGKLPKDDKWKARYREPIEADTTDLPKLPRDWTWASVDQMAAHEPRSITDGPFGSNLKSSHYTSSGPRVIRLQNIGDGVFVDEKAHISRKHYESLKDYAINEGDLVIRALGIPAPRACKIPDIGPAIVKADCIRLKVANEFIATDYVLLALNSPPTQDRTEKKIHGIGRPRLNLGEIKAIAIPLPPLIEQREIVREVERRLAAADRLAATLDRQLDRARATRQSLLRETFAGKLVPQNPNDEPAPGLLDRIRVAREADSKKPKAKRMSKTKSKTSRRPLLDVLHEHRTPMTPEQLFREAGFQPAQADMFYRELASLRKILREKKPSASEAKAWPHRAHVLLELKES